MQPASVFADRMEICGNTDIYFDCCKRLLECSELLVQAELGRHRISVWGHGLTASDFGGGGLHVHGEICTVEFDGGL